MALQRASFLVLIMATSIELAVGNDRHMICKDVENVFDEQVAGSQHPRRSPAGPPGKRGPEGPPGPKGDPGAPGEIDLAVINKTIQQLVRDQFKVEMKKVYNVLGQLNASKVDKQQAPDPVTKSPDKVCPADDSITFRNKCYWFILHDKSGVNFDRAQTLCTQSGGKPGDILDQEHYNMMEAKFREISTKTKWFWLGMTIAPRTKVVSYLDGTRASFTKWYPGYPNDGSSSTRLQIQISLPSGPQGMWNTGSGSTSHGAFCQEL